MKTTFVFPSTPVFTSNFGKPIVQFKPALKKPQRRSGHFVTVLKLQNPWKQRVQVSLPPQLQQGVPCLLFSKPVYK